MKSWLHGITIVFGLVVVGCSETEEPARLATLASIEVGEDDSYSNIYRVSTKHLALELDVNFENKLIYGIARHEIDNNHADTAIFDIKGLQIQKVTLGKKGHEKNTSYVIGIEDSIHGAPLSVLITPKTRFINIYYQTTEHTNNLHWNTDNAIQKKKFDSITDTIATNPAILPSFVYTLPGEKYTRNWIPIQDVSYKKINYSATVKVPQGMLPLMGTKNPTQCNDSSIYQFSSNSPVSVYDIGLCIADFKFKKLSNKVGVYFINKINKRILNEIKVVPSILKHTEKLYGKSPWKTTNFIVLPYTSPFESYSYPCNYFVNPSLFSRSNQSIFDLEKFILTHWPTTFFSNYCKNQHELEIGFATYYFNRFVSQQLGKDQGELATKLHINNCLLARNENFSSHQAIPNIYTKHCNEKKNIRSKEIAFKQLKGLLLMTSLEQRLGKEKLDYFVKEYLQRNQINSIDDFEHELNHFLVQQEVIRFPLKSWLYGKKIPPFTYNISSKRHLQLHIFMKNFLSNKKFLKLRKTKKQFQHFTQFDWLTFISLLPEHTSIKKLSLLDAQYHLSYHPNKNVQHAWIRYGKRNHYKGIEAPLKDILGSYGNKGLIDSFK